MAGAISFLRDSLGPMSIRLLSTDEEKADWATLFSSSEAKSSLVLAFKISLMARNARSTCCSCLTCLRAASNSGNLLEISSCCSTVSIWPMKVRLAKSNTL